ncbi:MAG: YajQ family cyclic di-GMP-binding protein [Candidatus Omnitrophica bacterium]|nr:YajQ family cyclic di-GMP-binding protein [Candidatus Omnitrophota bacterium]
MANEFSFDIVSRVDLQEVDNAINQAKKELAGRFDFKGSQSTIDWNRDEKKILLLADDELKLKNLRDILTTRLASRKVPLKSLEWGSEDKAFDGLIRQEVKLTVGIPGEKAKEIVKEIKKTGFKVQAAIQGDEVRVSSRSKDDLQNVIQHLKNYPSSVPLQFINYR